MTNSVRSITRIQDADDFIGTLTDTYVPVWSSSQSKFVMNAPAASGNNGQVQFNDGGVFGGDPGFIYDKTLDILRIGNYDWYDPVTPDPLVTSPAYGYDSKINLNHTVVDLLAPYDEGGYFAVSSVLALNDNHATGVHGGYDVCGINALVRNDGTYIPNQITALNASVENYSNLSPDIYIASLYASDYGNGNHGALTGVYLSVGQYGDGTITNLKGLVIDISVVPGATITNLYGIDISNVATITNATNKYAIRSQGGQVLLNAGASAIIPLVAKGAASQSANLTEWQDSGAVVQAAIGADGKIKTNQATANTNTPSGATAQKLALYDAAGSLLGYVPVYGSAW